MRQIHGEMPGVVAIKQKPKYRGMLNSSGSAATISVLIFTPVFLGLVIFAYTAAETSRTDQVVNSAAKNAVQAAVVCCGDAADASVAAENTVRASLASLPCRNRNSNDTRRPSLVRVSFIENTSPTEFRVVATISNPRSTPPSELRARLGDSLRPGILIQVSVQCELNFQNLTGFWLPIGPSTTRIADSTAVVNPFISQ